MKAVLVIALLVCLLGHVAAYHGRHSISLPIHTHHDTGGSYHHSSSHDKPHVREHTVYKPVYHKLTEIVQPHKEHYQIIKPVHKSIKTLVHEGHHHGYGYHGGYGGDN